MAHNGGRRPEEILAEIERTRTDMDETLRSIEERLTPGQLVDQGIDYLRGSGAPEFMQNLGGSVKANPLPVALVGIGLAWLMAAGRRPGDYSTSTGPSLGERASGMMQRLSEKAGSARERIGSARESAGGSMQSARERAGELSQSARERASQLGRGARDRVSGIGESARERYARARSGIDYLVHEQPLALGAIGLAIGAVLAAAAPRTRQEDRVMGEARDRLAEKATEAGKEQLHTAEQLASSAAGAAKEAVQREARGQSSPSQLQQRQPQSGVQTETTRVTESKTQVRGGPGSTPGTYPR